MADLATKNAIFIICFCLSILETSKVNAVDHEFIGNNSKDLDETGFDNSMHDSSFGSTYHNETVMPSKVEKSTSDFNDVEKDAYFNESNAMIFMDKLNKEYDVMNNNISHYYWDYSTNITDYNRNKMLEAEKVYGEFRKNSWSRVQKWKPCVDSYKNQTLKRQFMQYSTIGTAALPNEKYSELTEILSQMSERYSTAQICDFKNTSKCNLNLEPEIEEVMRSSRNYDELLHVWKSWRDASGKPSRNLYTRFVNLSNEAAQLNGFNTTAEMWISDYESESFEEDVENLYQQLSPLYQQLHAYVRRKLREVYGESKVSKRGPIPAHLTGNMWAQSWGNLFDILAPFKNKTELDVTQEMIRQNYTPQVMFEKANDFFVSLGLESVTSSFWENSVIEKPQDRKIVCHASAWDFSDRHDFRIKQCTDVDMEDLFVVHHEMGHIQYFMLYKHLPSIFRAGANHGFHEAVGDVLSLSVSTPKHLYKIGLLKKLETDYEADLNFLLKTALDTVAILPFAYLMDKFRWGVMREEITPENYTKAWWDHRYEYQGISPPIPRSEQDFDPASKYHVSANVRYIRYFVSKALQFQFYKSLCLLAGEYDPNDPEKPLHHCDIYGSKEAGEAFREMLSLGSSKPWPEALSILTGSKTMDASALLEYFSPLEKWLRQDNEKHGEFVGWDEGYPQFSEEKTVCFDLPTTASLTNMTEPMGENFMSRINNASAKISNRYTKVSWRYKTDINKINKQNLIEMKNEYGEFAKKRWQVTQQWKDHWPKFKNESLKRQFKKYSVLGTSALPKEKLMKLNALTTEMQEIYSTGKICDFKNSSNCNLSLEPEITNILRSSRDYDELLHSWKAWRDAIGTPSRSLYTEFVDLSNEAARLNGFPSTAEMWMHGYETETFEEDVAILYEGVKPLYVQLHAYVRRKLREIYGKSKITERGLIPAHLTGNMWAQSWDALYDDIAPFPNETSLDVTSTMVEKNYNPRVMFERADDFFASLGLEKVPPSFWNNSVIEKPEGREMVCHASAWDFSDGKDFRIKQCTDVNMEDFFTVHHELGHVQYYMQYKHLPYIYRTGANPGFHEAVGDILSLSVSTPKHLHKVGLLESYARSTEADINFLLKTALENVAFLPFGYMVDKYRWNIFRGEITPENYTAAWWDLRNELQGVAAPLLRTEQDFDPAAKYHVSSNVKYIRYFVSSILKFQFYQALCSKAGEYDPTNPEKPLHQCDIYQSKEAGKALREMLSVGSSVHWSQPLKKMTGTEEMNASPLREYFQPLEDWLKKNNKDHNEFVGWESG